MRAMTTVSAALPDDAPHLLVVDDDRRIRDLLSRFLLAEGYRVTTADTAAEARAKLGGLRAASSVPILMLTARGEAESRIAGLESGADDYVGKPFEPRELSLRVASILKRARPAPPPRVESVRFGDFVFHIGRGELKRGEEVIHLTDRERDMLRLLALAAGETVTRQALAGGGGGASSGGNGNGNGNGGSI